MGRAAAAAEKAPQVGPAPPEGACGQPQYSMEQLMDRLALTVQLPSVKSIADVDLEIASGRVAVLMQGAPALHLELPRRIDDAKAVAKFSKKTATLRVEAPYA